MSKTFSLSVSTINGEIQEVPVTMTFPCNGVMPAGESVIRDFDSSVNFIIAKRVYLINYNNSVYGTTSFKDVNTFLQYIGAHCAECACPVCLAQMNGCFVLMNGCTVDLCNGCDIHEVTMNNCFVLLNGCQALLN